MDTTTLGGVMRGYCAIGSDSRSMKKRENTGRPSLLRLGLAGTLLLAGLTIRGWLVRLVAGSATRRVLAGQRRHGHFVGSDLHARTHLLQAADHDDVVRTQALGDDAQAVF